MATNARFNLLMLRTVRLSGWPLLALMVLYLWTGFVLCGRHGLGKWMTVETALAIHRLFDLPLVLLFLAHCVPAVYLAIGRRGWKCRSDKA